MSAVSKLPKAKSELEELLALELRAKRCFGFAREFDFHPTRGWRFDFARQDLMLAVEVEGFGRHQTLAGFEDDCEKYNEAVLAGWTLLRFTGRMVRDGRAARVIQRVLREAGTRFSVSCGRAECESWEGDTCTRRFSCCGRLPVKDPA